MGLESSDGNGLLTVICTSIQGIHIHAATIALAEKVERLAIGTGHGVAVFTGMGRDIGVLTALGIVEPHIACNRRGVVLAPLVLVALTVLVIEALAIGSETEHLGRGAQHLEGATALRGYLI